MTVIYVDTLFLLNATVDYLLLLAAARLAGEPLRRPRFALGAVLGGGYAVAIFLPGLSFLSHPLCRVASALLMMVLAYGGSRRLLRQGILFVALTCAFGGGVVAIGLMGGTGLSLGSGVFYSPMDFKMVLLSAAVCYLVITLVFRRLGRHTGGELARARLRIGERSVELTALVDTGNTLTDPATGRGVLVVEGEKAAPLLDHPLGEAQLRDPVGTLARMEGKGRFWLLPYQAVGVACGLLLAVRLDKVRVGEREYRGVLAALSPTRLSDGGAYSALVGTMEA